MYWSANAPPPTHSGSAKSAPTAPCSPAFWNTLPATLGASPSPAADPTGHTNRQITPWLQGSAGSTEPSTLPSAGRGHRAAPTSHSEPSARERAQASGAVNTTETWPTGHWHPSNPPSSPVECQAESSPSGSDWCAAD